MYILSFTEAQNHEKSIGSKAKNLSILLNHQLPVPNGFVVTMEAFLHCLEYNHLNMSHVQEFAQILPTMEIPKDIQNILYQKFEELLSTYHSVAVRSSSAAEDLAGASFAGQYDTFLNITTSQDLEDKIRACWASMFTPHVMQYMSKMNLPVTELSMGVIVQGLIHSDVSGVLFSANPITHNPEQVVINASYGLGEAIVSGIVTPDLFIVDKTTRGIQKEAGAKEVKIIASQTGVQTLETSVEEQKSFCLSEPQIHHLADMSSTVEKLYDTPVDIEFGIQQGQIYLLQVRPVTTILSKFQQSIILTEADKQRRPFWIHDDSHFPGAKTPLFASFMIPAFNYGMNKAVSEFDFFASDIELKCEDYYFYQTMTVHTENMAERAKRQQEKMAPLFPHLKQNLYQAVEKILLPNYAIFDETRKKELSPKEAEDKLKQLLAFYKKAWEIHFQVVIPAEMLNALLGNIYEQLTRKSDPLFIHEQLVGVMNKTLETDRELWKLAKTVKNSSILSAAFARYKAKHLEEELACSTEGRQFLQSLHDMLSIYGYRKADIHEFAGTTWIENPALVLAHIQVLIESGYDFEKEFQQKAAQRQQSYESFINGLDDSKAKRQFMKLYEYALEGACVRDDHHFYIDAMLTAKTRLFLLHVGTLLVRLAVLKDAEDIFYLYYDEVLKALQHPISLLGIIEERKQEYDESRNKTVPSHYGTIPKEYMENPIIKGMFGSMETEATDTERTTFRGFAAAKGTYTGTVKVIHQQEDFSKLQKGDVLVCRTTTPAWTILFSSAGAVITDSGGILSHSGIIAREYRIPAVVGTKIATTTLQDGDIVMVNGTDGTVKIVESE